MFKLLRRSVVALLLLASMSAMVMAQSTVDGAIGGIIKDPQGAIVPNATVTVRNLETNKESTATTDSEGRFRVAQLQPGNYTVVVNASGFGTFTQEQAVVEVGRVTSLDVPLQVGNVSGETVNVTSDAPVINTTQQDFSTNINQTSINELPINGRRASDFVRLTPGVAPDGDFGLNSFRGISGLLNNSTVDGGDNNNAFFSEERGRTRISYVVSQASVREFQVNTSNYSSEYGRAAGGVVNTVTKSGTNQFHGSGFFYDRDNRLGARNPFSTRTLVNPDGTLNIVGLKPEDRRYQFGGTIGGPIIKDKLFFFFTYDQQKRNFPAVAAFADPRFLDLTARNVSTSPTTRREAIRANVRSSFPAGTTDATIDAAINQGVALLQSTTGIEPRRQDQRIIFPKIDWNINNKNSFAAIYNRLRYNSPAGIQSQAVVNRGLATFGDDLVDVDTLNLRLTSTIKPTLLNEARYQYSRENARAFLPSQLASEQAELARATVRPASGRLPTIDVASSSVGTRFGNPEFLDRRKFPFESRNQFADTVTATIGSQTIKFGGDINRVTDDIDNLRQESGQYNYASAVSFISDFIAPAGRRYTSFQQAFGLAAIKFKTTDYNFFIQDDYRVSPRLTVNLGLRYEYQRLPKPILPNAIAPTLTANSRFSQAAANALLAQTASFASDKNNFGPRVGFAYDVTGDGKTSLRGGYGIYYGRIINSTLQNALVATGAPGSQINVFLTPTTVATPAPPTYPNVLPSAPAGSIDIVAFAPNLANSEVHQADIILERQIARNTVISISGLLGLGFKLPRFVDVNLPIPTESRTFTGSGGSFNGQTFTTPVFIGPRPIQGFGRITEIRNDVRSEYEALVLQANRRLTKGLQFQVNYTFSRSLDSGQSSTTFTTGNNVLNSFDLSREGGRSNFDIPHRFVASAVYTPGNLFGLGNSAVGRAIFGGFTIAPIVQIASGRTLTPFVSGNFSGGTTSGVIGSGGSARPFFLPRNTFRQPKTATVDLRVSRRFRFTEKTNLEVLGEAFNLFNRTNVTNVRDRLFSVGGTNAAPTLIADDTFLQPSAAGNTIFRERQVQLAVRFEF